MGSVRAESVRTNPDPMIVQPTTFLIPNITGTRTPQKRIQSFQNMTIKLVL